jgi:hypothetical protein
MEEYIHAVRLQVERVGADSFVQTIRKVFVQQIAQEEDAPSVETQG